MGDLQDPRWLYRKAALFVVLGLLASALILAEAPSFKVAALLALAIWAFARAYYFAFYVVEHYIDGSFRYAGLGAFARHWWTTRRQRSTLTPAPVPPLAAPTEADGPTT